MHGKIGTHGIHNAPKRLPASRQPPPAYNQFAAGGGRPRLDRLPDPMQMVANRPSWRFRQQLPTSSSLQQRNPFEFGMGMARWQEQQQQHPTMLFGEPSAQPAASIEREPSPPPSHRSLGASTVFCACGTEWQSAPDSQRSLGGFSVIEEEEAAPDLAALRASHNVTHLQSSSGPEELTVMHHPQPSSPRMASGLGQQPQHVSFQQGAARASSHKALQLRLPGAPPRAVGTLRRPF